MQQFIAKYKDEVQGKLSGWDRLVHGWHAPPAGYLPVSAQDESLASHRHGTVLPA
jgi:hypothetical protein